MGTSIAGFLMSLVLIAIGAFAFNKGLSGNLAPGDAAALTGVLGMAAGLFGLTVCGMLVTHSLRLAKIEKSLDRRE